MSQEIILEKIEQFKKRLGSLLQQDISKEKLLSDTILQAAFERNIQVLIEQLLGIAVSVVKTYDLGYLSNPSESFDILLQKQVIDKPTQEMLRKAWGTRNVLVHGYSGIDYERLAALWPDDIKALAGFIELVLQYLERNK